MAAASTVLATEIEWLLPFWKDVNTLYSSVVTALILYPFLILAVRVFGKRSVSKMNNFDWIATVAIGAIIASAISFMSVRIVDSVAVILIILSLQWLLTFLTSRNEAAEEVLKTSPALLALRGEYIEETLDYERVSKDEIQAALRANGLTDISQAFAVVLETNAELSVISNEAAEKHGSDRHSALAQFDMSDIDGGPDGQPEDAVEDATIKVRKKT